MEEQALNIGSAHTAVVDWLSMTGLVAGGVSILLAIIAIVLSALFFGMSTRAETGTKSALEGIRGQTETLAKISGQQLKRLTDIVSEQIRTPLAADEITRAMLPLMDQFTRAHIESLIPPSLTSRAAEGTALRDHRIPLFPGDVDVGQLRETTLTFLCVTYYYAAYANYFSQASLPSPESYDETNDYHRLVRQLLDLSSADFRIVANVLEQWFSDEPSFIQNHRLTSLITEGQLVKDLIKSSAQRFDELRAEQAGPPST